MKGAQSNVKWGGGGNGGGGHGMNGRAVAPWPFHSYATEWVLAPIAPLGMGLQRNIFTKTKKKKENPNKKNQPKQMSVTYY